MTRKSNPILIFRKLKSSWRKAFVNLVKLGGISACNSVQIFHDGDQAFSSIYEEICKAKKSIFVETYIFAPDKVGMWLQKALIDAAIRGVKIVILYDQVGSGVLSQSFLKPMNNVGIKTVDFNPIWPWRRRGPLLFRDHRKIIVIDEEIAFCGSMNISADYAGPRYGNDRFRDTLAKIKGPAVMDLLDITLESIDESKFEITNTSIVPKIQWLSQNKSFSHLLLRFFGDQSLGKFANQHNGVLIQVLRSNKRRNLTQIQKSMEESINRAVSYCYFTTPYFLPYDALRLAIINAKKRGVDVRILTAGLSDVPLMRYASRHVYKSFLAHGIRIYEMHKKTLHAKIASIDGVHASIGSYNLDHWSARRNLEVNISMIDQEIALGLKKQFEGDLELCSEINKDKFLARSWPRKILCWLAYQLFKL